MQLAFVGMGSIGQRHLRNVRACLEQAGEACSIHLYRSGRGAAPEQELLRHADRQYAFEGGPAEGICYDAVFITNPTAMHLETIRRFAPAARAMFIEKPVFDRDDVDLDQLGLREDGVYYVACPLRCHPVIDYVRRNVPCETALAARAISSSYLPDWRPGTDYRATYSARRDLGGGVDIDLIHEWDYLTLLFGEVTEGAAIRAKLSGLEIDSPDAALYIARTERTAIELHLDYFGRGAMRSLQIFLPEETIDCDILNGTVRYLRAGETLSFDVQRDHYQMAEIRHFFDIVSGACPNDSDIPGALRVLRYARGHFARSL